MKAAIPPGARTVIMVTYVDAAGATTRRVIWPLALAFFDRTRVIVGWCETREAFRHFRTDRVVSADVLDESFALPEPVIAAWLAERQDQ